MSENCVSFCYCHNFGDMSGMSAFTSLKIYIHQFWQATLCGRFCSIVTLALLQLGVPDIVA